jgi:NAD(P)-dependent dehydrogenase (short-subunit alcohol dehydrogenase family)
MRGLSGKRFIIGGGATGIGAALAVQLVTAGARVVIGDINEAGLQTLAGRLQGLAGTALVMKFDLADSVSIDHLVQHCVDEFKGLDGLAIPGADLSRSTLGKDVAILEMDTAIWERTLKVNLIGHALIMRAAIPHLQKAGGGSIVAVSSGAAYMGMDTMPAYAASKAGIHALVRHIARAYGKDKIRCNGVAPGLVQTETAKGNLTPAMIEYSLKNLPLPRVGEPEDLASAMAFLLSDESTWISGQVLGVNGGQLFRD